MEAKGIGKGLCYVRVLSVPRSSREYVACSVLNLASYIMSAATLTRLV